MNIHELSYEQLAAAEEAFYILQGERFLPFDQVDEDPARAKLDQLLVTKVLGLEESLCQPDGPLDLLRRKLAAEPQIRADKKSRLVFTQDGEKNIPR